MLHLTWEKDFFLLAEYFINKAGGAHLVRSARCAAISAELQQVLSTWKLSERALHCILSPEVTFSYTARIEVPSGLEEIIPTLITLEAEKTIPFPLQDIVWDARFSFLEKEIIEVTYVGIEREELESFCYKVSEAGLEIEEITTQEGFQFSAPCLVVTRVQHQQKRGLQALAALIIFSLLVSCFYLSHEAARIKILTAQAALLLHQEKKTSNESTQTIAAARALKKRGAFLLSLVQARVAWPELLSELHQTLPLRYIWITKLAPIFEEATHTKHKSAHPLITSLEIEGLYLENPHQAAVVDEWVHKLKESSLFAIKEKRDEEIITLRCTPDNKAYAYPYKLNLRLKRPLTSYTSE